jgi:hypothetical protein
VALDDDKLNGAVDRLACDAPAGEVGSSEGDALALVVFVPIGGRGTPTGRDGPVGGNAMPLEAGGDCTDFGTVSGRAGDERTRRASGGGDALLDGTVNGAISLMGPPPLEGEALKVAEVLGSRSDSAVRGVGGRPSDIEPVDTTVDAPVDVLARKATGSTCADDGDRTFGDVKAELVRA